MQSGGPQSVCHMDPQRVATQAIQGGIWSSSVNTGINIFDLQHVKVNATEVV
jgi:hypothetical protein